MNNIISAPGKLMLLGEHSVVYGYPCIVTAVDKRVRVSIEKTDGKSKQDGITCPHIKDPVFVKEALKVFRETHDIPCVKIKTDADFTHNVGLGSSSAVTVAVIKALADLFVIKMSQEVLFEMSYKAVWNVQKSGSGFDVASAVYGKTMYYKNKGEVIKIISDRMLPLVVGYSGNKASTIEMIRKVGKDLKSALPIFGEITKIVEKARIMIQSDDFPALGQLFVRNHTLLQELGVSTERLDRMVEESLKAGAYGAKLSGAGGGDCMIALVSDEERKAVEDALVKAGGTVIQIKTCSEGVKRDI